MAANRWGMWGMAYPLNLPLQIGLFELLGGDTIPLSKALFPLYLLSLVVGCYAFWRRRGVAPGLAAIGVGLLVTNPIFVRHSTEAFANLPFSCYLVLGLLWLIEASTRGSRRAAVLSSTLLGLAAWTRPEGALYLAAIVVAAGATALMRGGGRLPWLWWLAPAGVIAIPWLLVGRESIGGSHLGEAMGGILEPLMRGQLNLRYLMMVPMVFVRRAVLWENWGLFIPAVALLLGLGLPTLVRRRPPGTVLSVFVASVLVALPVMIYYLRSFTRPSNLEQILVRDFDRAFMPAAVMLIVVGVWASAQNDRGRLQPLSVGEGRGSHLTAPSESQDA